MKKKLITVIIPTFGRSEFLIRAVNSILKQSYTKFEIIIVDDNGRGNKEQINTYNKISELLDKEHRIRYIIHDYNKNGSAARNTGIKYSKGEYICFLDDDDEFFKDKLLKQYKLLEKSNKNWIACYTGHIRNFDNKSKINLEYKPNFEGDLLYPVTSFSVDACSGSTLMIRKEIIKKVKGFNEKLERHQDYEFLAKVAYYGKIKVISEPMVRINVHEGSYRQKSYDDIENTRLKYLQYIKPYLNKLSSKKKKRIYFINNYWLLKKSIFYKRYYKIIKYFLLCKNPFLTIYMLFKDSVNYLKRGGSLNE